MAVCRCGADGGCHGRGAHVGFATGFPSAIKTRSMIEAMRPALYAAPPPSVSVLPFEDLGISSAQPEKQYIASGLTQELTAELARLRGLKVIVGRLISQPRRD